MSNYYETDSSKGFLLYPYDHQVILRQKLGHAFNRPQILCNDYASNLFSEIYQGNLYYVYINQQNHLVLRSTIGQAFPFIIESNDSVKYMDPMIFSLNQKLFLFYIEHNRSKNLYSIHLKFPFETENSPILFEDSWNYLPSVMCKPEKNGVLFHIQVQTDNLFVFLTPNFECIRLESIATMSIDFDNRYHALEQSSSIKYQQLESALERSIMQLATQNAHLSEVKQALTNAIKQYNELMQVASQYKEEAEKWYNLYMNGRV